MKAMRLPLIALLAGFIFNTGALADGSHLNICEQELVRAAALHNVPLGMLYAVGLTESGQNGKLTPYAINVDGRARYNLNKVEALAAIEKAQSEGARYIDIGCMQINHRYHGRKFDSLEEMFDPEKNVAYAARFLSELKQREGTWTMAIARYHAGPKNFPAQKAYVCRVIKRMVSTGFGEWTDEARQFCAG